MVKVFAAPAIRAGTFTVQDKMNKNQSAPQTQRLRPTSPETGFALGLIDRIAEHWWAAFALVAIVFGLYFPAVGFDFVNWDDPWYVIENPMIRSWHPANLFRMATSISVKNYAPVTMFSFLVDHTLWGAWPGGYHLTNLLLHAVNSVLVYLLVQQLTGSRWAGWLTAALFAVHPVHVESVAWVSSRKGLLAGCFILASLICWLRPDRTERAEAWALAFFALALLSKAVAVVVPAIVLSYDFLVRRERLASALARQFIPGMLAGMLLLVTMAAQPTEMGGVRGHLTWSKPSILAADSVILWLYVKMLAWPGNLCVLYDPVPAFTAKAVAVASFGWLAAAAAVYRCRRRFPMVTVSLLAFWLFLLPVLNLFPITTLMNDRYLYLPSIPILGLAVALILRAPSAVRLGRFRLLPDGMRPVLRPAGVLVLMGMLVGLAAMTQRQLPVWKHGTALWQHAAHRVPHLPVVQIQLADSLHQQGRRQEAIAVLEAALADTVPDRLDRTRIRRKLQDWRNGRAISL